MCFGMGSQGLRRGLSWGEVCGHCAGWLGRRGRVLGRWVEQVMRELGMELYDACAPVGRGLEALRVRRLRFVTN